jgi:hypothetical protein
MNCYCSFCASAGVAGPHDHFLRAAKALGSGVTCPKLLATKCVNCGRNGHTARFCGEGRDQMHFKRIEAIKASHAAMERGDWMPAGKLRNKGIAKVAGDRPNGENLASRFGSLDIETGAEHIETVTPVPSNDQTWAQVARVVANEEKDDELPPLMWGKATSARWGDHE